ncbi:MAG: glycosyltransferase family 87 protein [Anaerolineae bacterium]
MNKITWREVIILTLVLVLVYFTLAYALYAGITSHVAGANDYFSRWMGAKLLIEKGMDPYSDAVTQQIQLGMWGRVLNPDEDQVAFAYPLYVVFFTWPLVGLAYPLAQALWMTMLAMLIGGAMIAFGAQFKWPLTRLGFPALIGLTFLIYPTVRGLFSGQYVLITCASLAMGIVLISRRREGWAGAVLALGMVKPHIAILPLAVILGWGLWHRRWRLLGGFTAAMAVMGCGAMLLVPQWPLEFIAALTRYYGYYRVPPPIQVLTEIVLLEPFAGIAASALSLIMYAWLGYCFIRTVRNGWDELLPTIQLAMIVTTMAMLRTASSDQTILLMFWIPWMSHWLSGPRRWIAPVMALVLIGVPWATFFYNLHGSDENIITTTAMVTLTLAAYLVVHWSIWPRVGQAHRLARTPPVTGDES